MLNQIDASTQLRKVNTPHGCLNLAFPVVCVSFAHILLLGNRIIASPTSTQHHNSSDFVFYLLIFNSGVFNVGMVGLEPLLNRISAALLPQNISHQMPKTVACAWKSLPPKHETPQINPPTHTTLQTVHFCERLFAKKLSFLFPFYLNDDWYFI